MPALNDLAARTELRPFESLTLTDQQFLTGDKNGKAVTLAGELRLPPGASGRLPAVILAHGSGGTGPREEFWAKYFNEMGVASFVIDSFSGRGLADLNPDQAHENDRQHQPAHHEPSDTALPGRADLSTFIKTDS